MALPKPPTAQQIQKAAMAKASAGSPYYYGGGGFKPKAQPPAGGWIGGPGGPGTITGRITPTGYTPPLGGGGGGAGAGGGGGGDIQTRPRMPGMPTYEEPDWNSLINSNYLTQEAESQAGPMRAQSDIGLKQGIASALYNYGWDPNTMNMAGWGAAAPYVDQGAINAAQGNQYSALSQISRNQDLAQRAAEAKLASRGILSSGQLTTDTGDIATEAGGQRQNAYSTLMGAVNTGIQKRADAESQIAQMLQNARAQAAAFVAQNYQAPSTGYMPEDWLQQLGDYFGFTGGQPQVPTSAPPPAAPPLAPAVVPKAPVPKVGVGSANSPYYYGGGGYKPVAPKKKK